MSILDRFGKTVVDLNHLHLIEELGRIDARLRRAVALWQQAGQNTADDFRGLYVADDEAIALLELPAATTWGDAAALPPAEESAYQDALREATQRAGAVRSAATEAGIALRLERLRSAFGLDQSDYDAFLICLAPALDLRYEKLFGYLQDDVSHRRPSVALIANLLSEPGQPRLTHQTHFAAESPLFVHRLLEWVPDERAGGHSVLTTPLRADPAVVAWLCGQYQPPTELAERAHLATPDVSDEDLLLAGETAGPLHPDQWRVPADSRPLFSFSGPDDESRAAAARLLAAWLGRPLLTVELPGPAEPPDGLPLRLALRDARLTGALLCLTGWDTLVRDGTVAPALLAELFAHTDTAIVSGRAPWQPQGIRRDKRVIAVSFPAPSRDRRVALWGHFLGEQPDKRIDLNGPAGQFQLTAGRIRDAAQTAADRAAHAGRPVAVEDLYAAARAHSGHKLCGLSRKIPPRYDWNDLVLPEDQLTLLRELVSMVQLRPRVLDAWGLGRKLVGGRGVTALFSGPPGTGKTMAAEVIAGQLGLDLYRIDLSSTVSKYIGETEKNLERVFEEAANSNAILFFDEADALFGKRSEVRDAHDRYANIEISYLLQRMETYDGVTILATNLRANLDDAFARRLDFAVDFPFPEEQYRRRIWQALFPTGAPHKGNLDFDFLARRFRLSGGNIRNILVSAAYLAAADGQVITMSHLLHGARRELQKMGRLVGEEEVTSK